jgi:hypothetical protein
MVYRMVIRISMDGPGADEELRSLRAWLEDSPDVGRNAVMSWQIATPQTGYMGAGAIEWLELVTSNTWSAASFALAYAAWCRSRRLSPAVTIEHNGVTLSLDGADAETVARITRMLAEEQEG